MALFEETHYEPRTCYPIEAVGSTVSFRLHPDARDELREAVVFYDRAAEGS